MNKVKNQHWAFRIADKLILEMVDPSKRIVCASGISPSGVVHAGNLREIMTSDLVYRAIKSRGRDARLLFSWDDFDRFRKVPVGIPTEFSKYIGMPYNNIPDPFLGYSSYAERFETQFENEVRQLGISADFIKQNEMYRLGIYDDQIRYSLLKRREIAQILARNMTQGMSSEEIESYYPISIYSRFTGRDNTDVISFDGESKLGYICHDTGKKDVIDFTKDKNVKLPWKVDWPMRWKFEGVHFEPGGSDHAGPGGSYDVASQIAKEIFGIIPPTFIEYQFVRIKGSSVKMSSSKGNVFSPEDLINIYPPMLVRWMYARANPGSLLDIAFDSDVIRAYDEFDRTLDSFRKGSLEESVHQAIELSTPHMEDLPLENPISFRQIAGMGDATNFNEQRVLELLNKEEKRYDLNSVKERLSMARNWMDKYCPEARSRLLGSSNEPFYDTLNEFEKAQLKKLIEIVTRSENMNLEQIEFELYNIPRKPEMTESEKKQAQRQFFKIVYMSLFGREIGPRLPTFVWASDKSNLLKLLR